MLRAVGILLAVMVTLSGCSNPMGYMSSDALTDSDGTVRILLDSSSLQARTVNPDFNAAIDSIDHYSVSLEREGYEGFQSSVSGDAAAAEFSNVAAGTWNISVQAFAVDDTLLAAGSVSHEVGGGGTSISVPLEFLEDSGVGTISLNLTIPAGAVSSAEISIDGAGETLSISPDQTQIQWSDEKDAGDYVMVVKLKDSTGNLLASIIERAKVYGNLVSEKAVDLLSPDLNGPPEAPSNLSAEQDGEDVLVTWTDVSHVETGFEIERSINDGASWTGLDDELAANTISFTDNTAVEDTTYRYRVKAVNSFGESSWVESDPLTVVGTIAANNDTLAAEDWNFYPAVATTIPFANLTSNDVNNYNTEQILIVSVSGASNGSVSLGENSITFTGTTAGQAASFNYTARIQGTSYEDTATVTIEAIEEAPPLIAKSDGPYDIQQGGEEYLTVSQLTGNDSSNGSISFSNIVSGSEQNCTVSLSGSTLTVTSTGLAYEPAQFQYKITDSPYGNEAVGTVYLNVGPLAPVDGYVFTEDERDITDLDQDGNTTETAFDAMKNSYQPATMQEVFDSWPRVSGTYYYTAQPYSGYADDWYYATDDGDGDGDPDPRVVQPSNVSPPEGFVCPEDGALEYFTFEATLFSDNSDNDSIGLIIAFVRDGSTNKYLVAHRTTSGNAPRNGWGISYYEGSYQTVLAEISTDETGADYGWDSKKTRVKVQRIGDTVKCWMTDWDDVDTYMPESLMEINLANDTVNGTAAGQDLEVFRGAAQYGYFTYSQPYSTYLDIEMSGGISADTLIKLADGSDTDSDGSDDRWTGSEVWKYISGSWTLQSGGSIQDELGYVREVTNPETERTFLIKETRVEEVSD